MPGAWPSDGVSAPRDRYKRAFDLTALAVAFVALAPLWLLLAASVPLAIRLLDGGSVLYRQRRLGRHGRVFAMLKFRSMPVHAEAATGAVWAGQPDARATPLGRLLRRLRLDELPQVVNVLRGEMSLVGPRPERPELVGCCEREAPGFARRLAVLPGIAGLAQARLGSAAGPADKLRCDLIYIGAMGPWLDARLCVASLVRLLREAVAPVPAPVRGRRRPCRMEGRYLRYDYAAATAEGLNHQRRNLECLLAEAHTTGRLAVAPPPRLSAAHNFGVARAWRWETYFDLEASALVDAVDGELPLPLARGPVPATPALTVGPGERLPAAPDAALAVRRVRRPVWSRDVPRIARAGVSFAMRPSARVRQLAAPVLAALRARWPEGFVAVHVRRGDRLFGPIRWFTRPPGVRRRLRALGVRDGSPLFLLTDERDPGFRRALVRDFEVAASADFPALAALVDPGAGGLPDNYLLYEVEKAVMRGARVRVETFPGPEYEPADGVLVPSWAWRVSRLGRRTAHATLRLARRTLGERAWESLRALRRVSRTVRAPGRRTPRTAAGG